MAKNRCIVLLGYEDDPITEKSKHFIDYSTNKVGGKPDWPNSEIYVPPCTICAAPLRLIVQIYAPLDNSAFHRTLYIFACVNGPCSSQSQAWVCVRTQVLEKHTEKEPKSIKAVEKIEWCTGADDWGEEEQAMDDLNSNEENGNVISSIKCDNRMSDEDDESNSFGSDPLPGFNNLGIDDKNANCGGAVALAEACAIGGQPSPNRPTAEIEGTESEVILIDTPQVPQKDVMSLLSANQMSNISKDELIQSFFISVEEEFIPSNDTVSEHIRDLIEEYEMRDDTARTSPEDPNVLAAAGNNLDDSEQYERGVPLHGDLMFHTFLSRIQENPSQIVRYSRDAAPLLIAPLKENIQKCQNCGADVICEFQILPTLIPKLKFENNECVPIDFGNVLIFTCIKSCWDTPDRMRFEHVVVQQEDNSSTKKY